MFSFSKDALNQSKVSVNQEDFYVKKCCSFELFEFFVLFLKKNKVAQLFNTDDNR